MNLYRKILAILAVVIPLNNYCQASTCDSVSLKLMEQTWREFRAIHPFGFQTVGLKNKGDTCLFIISEPSEWVKTEDLVALFTKHDGHLIECIQPYGFDGELHDIIGCVRKDSIDSVIFRSELFNLLYYTDYKAYYTDLNRPTKHVYFTNKKLNFEISDFNLNLSMSHELFKVSNKKRLSIYNILKLDKNTTNKIYFSLNRGYVAWVVDSIGISRPDSSFLKHARTFALDTDIILGTIYESGKIAIIGREREISVNILPPLRSETLRLLAESSNRRPHRYHQLSGMINRIRPSYDYSSIITPFFINHETDTIKEGIYQTPIWMDSQLRNTELGNLMYLTDIILKSWCENGKVKDLFLDYPIPKPNKYPYPNGVTQELGYIPHVSWIFDDWNGANKISCCRPTIYSTARKDSVQIKKEWLIADRLYDFFSNQKNVDLIRVRQYAILYNAFQYLNGRHFTLYDSEETSPFTISTRNSTKWRKTPTLTISDNNWVYGGFQVPVKILRGLRKGATPPPPPPPPPLPPTIGNNILNGIGTTNGNTISTGVVGVGSNPTPPLPSITHATSLAAGTQFMSPFSLRKGIIHAQPKGTKRGFDTKLHNTSPKELQLSESQLKVLFERSDHELKMMEEMRKQIQQLKIPKELIRNEQRTIILAIIINQFENKYNYEQAT